MEVDRPKAGKRPDDLGEHTEGDHDTEIGA